MEISHETAQALRSYSLIATNERLLNEVNAFKQQVETLTQELKELDTDALLITCRKAEARVEALEAAIRTACDALEDWQPGRPYSPHPMRDHLLKALNHHPTSQWVSVEERLPEDSWQKLLVLVSDECEEAGMHIGAYHDGEWDINDEALPVTHWMPLPAPPEVSDGD